MYSYVSIVSPRCLRHFCARYCCLHRRGHQGLPPIQNAREMFLPIILGTKRIRIPWRRARRIKQHIQAMFNGYSIAVYVWRPRRGRYARDHPRAYNNLVHNRIKAEELFTDRLYGRTHVYICLS